MQGLGSGPAPPPEQQDPKEVDRLERLPKRLRFPFQKRLHEGLRDFTETTRSVASNPEESRTSPEIFRGRDPFSTPQRARQLSRHTDIEGDDERTSDDNDDTADNDKQSITKNSGSTGSTQRIAGTPGQPSPKFYSSRPPTAKRISRKSSPSRRPKLHSRTVSGITIRYGLSTLTS